MRLCVNWMALEDCSCMWSTCNYCTLRSSQVTRIRLQVLRLRRPRKNCDPSTSRTRTAEDSLALNIGRLASCLEQDLRTSKPAVRQPCAAFTLGHCAMCSHPAGEQKLDSHRNVDASQLVSLSLVGRKVALAHLPPTGMTLHGSLAV